MTGTSASSSAAIEIHELNVRRGGAPALRDVTLAIPRGTVTGLLGPSGCGKTTLMRCIVGTQIVESGTVTVLGRPAGAAALRRRIGYVTQAPSVYLDLTIRDNVRYFASLYGRGNDAVADTIEAVGLTTHTHHQAGDLSGGQLGRVSLACALVAQPELLVLDEPTVGLDPVLRAELWEHFASLAAAGTTLLVSSHVMDEADHCENLLLLRDGRLLAHVPPDELRRRTGKANLEEAFLSLIREHQVGVQP
ncbi:ABC transporter ATP-binding protein [Rhodococcus sp. TAF43]|uniref:ABC transporter ATP-binding protein n=1 Tax=unclassified Rhodococcus (in: high G+C Gram-positive bacteria) TaxID=192944 RepID=UPI001583846F|nr:ABC transporter ATP-binding protein [Rhodococcus sp. W8901]QKT11791.1 ABC transporter ATP-binding protein [Rhodococcus sp. W8901]